MHESIRRSILAASLAALASGAAAQLPNIAVDPSNIDFGEVNPGDDATVVIRVRSLGPGVLNILSVGVQPTPPFRLPPPGSFPIPGGQFWLAEVTFAPTAAGDFNGVVRIRSNDPEQPVVDIPVTGTGVAPPPPEPDPTPPPVVVPPPPVVVVPPPAGELSFSVEPQPNAIRLTPGRTGRVVYRILNRGERLTVHGGDAFVTLPDGSEVNLRARSFERSVPAGGSIEVTDSVLLPEAFYDAASNSGSREAEFRREFHGEARGGAHDQVTARVRLIPVGRLGADFDLTSIAIEYPPAGAVIPLGSELHARALLTGNGSGTAFGEFVVDGVTVETVSVDLTGGRRTAIESMLSLPTSTPGSHRLELRIVEPRRLRSRVVRYFVPARTFERMRLTNPPGFRVYLLDGRLPSWKWTPRATARGYQVQLDDLAPFVVRLPRYTLTETLRVELGAGPHDIRIRPLLGSSEGAGPLDDDALEGRFRLISEPSDLITNCDGMKLCDWSGIEGDGLYRVSVNAVDDSILYDTITSHDGIDFSSRAGEDFMVWNNAKFTVEAKNDFNETVARGEGRR